MNGVSLCRQQANSGFVISLHGALEKCQLSAFLDANNLEMGLNFKLSFMEAIGRSLVACPVVSAGAMERMQQLASRDFCDNVLLEWMTMLALYRLVRSGMQHRLVRLRRIVPLFLGNAWLNDNSLGLNRDNDGHAEGDSFADIEGLARALPNCVSRETYNAFAAYCSEVLHMEPPPPATVRDIVVKLLEINAVVEFGGNANNPKGGAGLFVSSKELQLQDHASTIRQAVAAACQDFHVSIICKCGV